MKKLILINGLKRSGKDYTTDLIKEYIKKEHNQKTQTFSFASPIKEIASELFQISLEDLDDYKNDSDLYGIEIKAYPNNQPSATIKYLDFRTILQRLGSEAIKPIFGDDVWAVKAIQKVQESEDEWNIISDFRFISEFKEAKRSGELNGFDVITINIFNDELPSPDAHASETELKDKDFKFDFVINNTGQPNIDDLVQDIVENLRARIIS